MTVWTQTGTLLSVLTGYDSPYYFYDIKTFDSEEKNLIKPK